MQSEDDINEMAQQLKQTRRKYDLLVDIESELGLPGRGIGFNDRDDTISKTALARILAGIRARQIGGSAA